jgi:endonuclease/exonuclease/phosphatase (EEP) superfamily protein YafD
MITWILLLPWLLFLTCHGALSGRTWLWALPEMVPPIAFVLVPLVAVVSVSLVAPRGGWEWAALLGLLLLGAGMRWNGVDLPRTSTKAPSAEALPLALFAWNTEFWDQGKDLHTFIDFLRAQDADVYLLQEYAYWGEDRAVPPGSIEKLGAAMPDHQVFTQGELAMVVRRDLAPRLGPGIEEIALRVDVSVGRAAVAIYNVHMPEPVDLGRSPLRLTFYRFVRSQARKRGEAFRALQELLVDAPRTLLMAGDFNSSPAMRLMNRLRAQYVDVMRTTGSPYLATWPAGRLRLWRIDWILGSGDMTTEHARLVAPQGLSDHEGQFCVLQITQHRE